LVANKKFGSVVVLKNNKLCSTSLKNVANKSRLVTTQDPTLTSALSMGICFGNAELVVGLQGLSNEILGAIDTID